MPRKDDFTVCPACFTSTYDVINDYATGQPCPLCNGNAQVTPAQRIEWRDVRSLCNDRALPIPGELKRWTGYIQQERAKVKHE